MFLYDFQAFLVKFFQILGFWRLIQNAKIIEGLLETKETIFLYFLSDFLVNKILNVFVESED